MVEHFLVRPRLRDASHFLEFLRERVAGLIPAEARDLLDAGSGSGALLERLGNRTRAVALDKDVRARHGLPVLGDLARLPFRAAVFDAVACVNLVPWLAKDAFVRGLEEMVRVLRPGGTLILDSLNLDHPLLGLRTWMRNGKDLVGGLRESRLRRQAAILGLEAVRFEWILPHSFGRPGIGTCLAEAYALAARRIPRLAPRFVCSFRRNR